jgi:putative transposase
MGLGYVEGVTHDYVRHGTTTLFAALDIATGHVLARCKTRHRHQEYLSFLKHVDANVPQDLDIHLVVDNYSTHKHPTVKRWLAVHPRYQVHYTPTYASIDHFVKQYNTDSSPFVWTATADSILEKIKRLCQYISET